MAGRKYKVSFKKYITGEGNYVTAKLPEQLQGYHFGPVLRKYILVQYYDCHVTQPLLLQQLQELGVAISSGELNNLLINDKEDFHQEKEAILTKKHYPSAAIFKRMIQEHGIMVKTDIARSSVMNYSLILKALKVKAELIS